MLIAVPDTVGELRATALARLSDFDVRVEVDCDVPILGRPVDIPLVVDQDPRAGRHPEGSEVVIVSGPSPHQLPC